MPFKKMENYAKDEGFCCIWAMLTSRKKYPTSAMAEEAPMTPKAVRLWRQQERAGKLSCPGPCPGCMKKEIIARRKSS